MEERVRGNTGQESTVWDRLNFVAYWKWPVDLCIYSSHLSPKALSDKMFSVALRGSGLTVEDSRSG